MIVDKTGRIFYHHDLWEDHLAGLYRVGIVNDNLIKKSAVLLSDQELFWDVMCRMRNDWPHCFRFNVSNKTQNRKAWLGQASCCYSHGAEFNITIEAWGALPEKIKVDANHTAQKMIELFEFEEMKNAEDTIGRKRVGRCNRTHCMDF